MITSIFSTLWNFFKPKEPITFEWHKEVCQIAVTRRTIFNLLIVSLQKCKLWVPNLPLLKWSILPIVAVSTCIRSWLG